jgi:hypothetical protein
MATRALLLVAAAPVAAAAAASCTGPSSCSLNGDCAADGQSCVCDAGWTGELCSALKQGQSTRVWPPAGTAGQDPAHLSASWGAGLVPPVKGVSEKWHLYVDSICIGPAPLMCSHTHMAQLVHATAAAADGPYEFADVAVLPSANNPAAVYDPVSKLYLLYYLDMCLGGPPDCPPLPTAAIANWTQCTGAVHNSSSLSSSASPARPAAALSAPPNPCMGRPGQTEVCEKVAIASSPSPNGPWIRHFPVLSAACTPPCKGRQSVVANPAPFVFPNGSVLMVRTRTRAHAPQPRSFRLLLCLPKPSALPIIALRGQDCSAMWPRSDPRPSSSLMQVYRYNPPGGQPAGEVLAVAIAETWKGPYNIIADNITNLPNIAHLGCPTCVPANPSAEDPIIFQNKRGYHIVYHQYNQSDKVTGGHIFSPDARNWTVSPEAV